jgi:hypothetical protein
LRERGAAGRIDSCARGAWNLRRLRGVFPGNRAPLLLSRPQTISGDIAMARKFDRTPDVTVFLAILLTALAMSAVLTQLRAQTSPGTAPPAATAPAEPATPENAPPITPRTEAEAACRAIGNQEQRAQCLAAITPGGATPTDTTPPPPAELRRPSLNAPNSDTQPK